MAYKKSKNSRNIPSSGNGLMLLVWGVVFGLTVVRLIVATTGALGESEALLCACAFHPAGGYVEGPCGVPLLVAVLITLKPFFSGSALLALRWLSPIAALILSWSVWWIARRLSPRTPSVAVWSVIGFNLLPWVNLSSLIMDGAMVRAAIILLCVVAGWNAATFVTMKKQSFWTALAPWLLFGIALGIGTLFYYPIGLLMPVVVIARLLLHRGKEIPWLGLFIAFGFLVLGWMTPLLWNARHDWIQWSSVARGFDSYDMGGFIIPLSLCVTASAILIPWIIKCSPSTIWMRGVIVVVMILSSVISSIVLAMPSVLQGGYPSPLGVQRVGDLARELLSLQKDRPDAKGQRSFLIAQSAGLAALLGEKMTMSYPKSPGSPGVFVAESPSMNSSYALWPSYADAQESTVKDLLYSEENTVSPFLGRNALYITTETREEIPQTITGAFNAVGLLKEMSIIKNGQPEVVRIYQCEGYKSLSL
jgi:hypothetical protein